MRMSKGDRFVMYSLLPNQAACSQDAGKASCNWEQPSL